MKINLLEKEIDIIVLRKCRIYLNNNNTRATSCKDCRGKLEVGAGVHRDTSFGKGFICFKCLRAELFARTYDRGFPGSDAGFHLDKWNDHAISQCFTGYPPRQFTTLEVIQAVKREWKYDALDRLQGTDSIPAQKIEDAVDSFPIIP